MGWAGEFAVVEALSIHRYPTRAGYFTSVEGFFSIITRRKICRGVFKSVADLEEAIRRYIRDHNGQAKPFAWTKTAKAIFEKLSRLPSLQRVSMHRADDADSTVRDPSVTLIRGEPNGRFAPHSGLSVDQR
jgi:hypothetical protein